MNEQIDKFRQAVRLGQYTEALAIFHDHGNESYVRLLLGEIEFLLGVIEDSAKKRRRFNVILDQDAVLRAMPTTKLTNGSIFVNTDTGATYEYDGDNWIE